MKTPFRQTFLSKSGAPGFEALENGRLDSTSKFLKLYCEEIEQHLFLKNNALIKKQRFISKDKFEICKILGKPIRFDSSSK